MSGKTWGYIIGYAIGVIAFLVGFLALRMPLMTAFGIGTVLAVTVLLIAGAMASPAGPAEGPGAIFGPMDFDTPRGFIILVLLLASYGVGALLAFLVLPAGP
jgi:hypothetical protein